MKRSELAEEISVIEGEIGNGRAWILSAENRLATLRAKLSAPPQAEPKEPEPTSGFTVKESGGREEGRPAKVNFRGDPAASSAATLVTPKQLGMIRALAREANVDYEAECLAQLNCKPEDLSKRAASAFIEYLQVIKDEGAEFRKVG